MRAQAICVGGARTALSQYFSGVHFPECVAHRDALLALKRAEIARVKEKHARIGEISAELARLKVVVDDDGDEGDWTLGNLWLFSIVFLK